MIFSAAVSVRHQDLGRRNRFPRRWVQRPLLQRIIDQTDRNRARLGFLRGFRTGAGLWLCSRSPPKTS